MEQPPERSATGYSFLKRWAIRFTYLYIVSVVAVWLVLRFTADEWWAATLFVFGPRWVVAVPLLVLIPLALWTRSWRLILVLFVAGLVVAGPVTGAKVSSGTWWSGPNNRGHIRVLSCNVDGPALKGSALELLIAEARPDVVVLQEAASPQADTVFPKGWHMCQGPGGLWLGSRFPVKDSAYLTDQELGMQGRVGRYRLETPIGEIIFVNVHLPTPRLGFEPIAHADMAGIGIIRDEIVKRNQASAVAREWLGEIGPTTFIAGDFNMPAESMIFRRHWSDLDDAFDEAGWGWGFTKQTSWFGVRIDHVLAGKAWGCSKAWVGPDVGSDHLPLIADFAVRAE